MPTEPIQLTPEIIQREINRFAKVLIEGKTMPLLMLGIDLPTNTIQVISGPIILDRMRISEYVQETVYTRLRDSLGRLVMGPDSETSTQVEGL